MIIKGELPFLEERPHRIALVGAGGKTTVMYAAAASYAKRGFRTLVTTTTHIFRPPDELWARDRQTVKRLWEEGSYAVVGRDAGAGKLTSLSGGELSDCLDGADIVLYEADGAKRLPCKVPAAHEPVIPKVCDLVIGVMGMDAPGHPIGEICFRGEEATRLLHASLLDRMTVEMMAEILSSEEGTRKYVGGRPYYVVLNKCDTTERIRQAERIRVLLCDRGIDRCVLTSFLPNERI